MEAIVTKNQKQLRCGFTTGTCAAVATKAAVSFLLSNKKLLNENSDKDCSKFLIPQEISLIIPKGVKATIPVELISYGEDWAEFCVIKDSGDDPDVTNGTRIVSRVTILKENKEPRENCFIHEEMEGIYLDGGIGVGRITKAGLEQAIGKAAINKVPRQMIFEVANDVREQYALGVPLFIEISVPEGEVLAKKTFNSRLGIEGGISILGTSGMIEPMSEKALVDTIEAFIRQKHNLGEEQILVAPGNYGQAYMEQYLGLSLTDSIKCSNYIGETIDLACFYGMKRMLLVGNIGKLCKLAAGIMNTHSKVADGRGTVMALYAMLAGANMEVGHKILESINTDEMLRLMEDEGVKGHAMELMMDAIERNVNLRTKGVMEIAVLVFSETYGFLGATRNAEAMQQLFKEGKEEKE